MVSNVVEDMREKILQNLVTPENIEGFCYGEVNDYLEPFDAATKKLRA